MGSFSYIEKTFHIIPVTNCKHAKKILFTNKGTHCMTANWDDFTRLIPKLPVL